MTPDQERIRANDAQQLLDNPVFKEVFMVLEEDLMNRMKRTKFKEKDERDEIWRKLQTMEQIKQIINRYVTTGKMQKPTFTDKIRNIGG